MSDESRWHESKAMFDLMVSICSRSEKESPSIATLTHKVRTTQQPAYLASLINSYEPERALRSSNAGLLSVPRTRTALASRAFSVCAPVIWNSLPQII